MAAVLVVDDDPSYRRFFKLVLEEAGHRVTAVRDDTKALAQLRRGGFDLVLADLWPPTVRLEASQFVKDVQSGAGASSAPVVAVGAHDNPIGLPLPFLRKPMSASDLEDIVSSSLPK